MPLSNYLGMGKRRYGLGFKNRNQRRPLNQQKPIQPPGNIIPGPKPIDPNAQKRSLPGGEMNPVTPPPNSQNGPPGLNTTMPVDPNQTYKREMPISNPEQTYGLPYMPPGIEGPQKKTAF